MNTIFPTINERLKLINKTIDETLSLLQNKPQEEPSSIQNRLGEAIDKLVWLREIVQSEMLKEGE